MAVEIGQQVCDGYMLKALTAAGLAWLEQNHEHVNQLNVFPVPDGDTGTNMLLTMRSAYEHIVSMDEGHIGIVGDAIARGALMGARGNSGVILSQLWQGFARAVRGHELLDATLLADAVTLAVDAGYDAVVQPVEGTILTVARAVKEAVLSTDETDLRVLLTVMVQAAKGALTTTPDLLPVLKKAGVVDSGGQGLVYVLEGMLRAVSGDDVISGNGHVLSNYAAHTWQSALEPEDEEGYGYDVQFLMHGENLDVSAVRAAIEAMGWSTLVVGSETLIKVHVHVHDPGQPLSYAINTGAWIDDIVVENMQAQYETYVQERRANEGEDETDAYIPDYAVAVVTVASGDGLHHVFKHDLHAAYVIAGGQTMNPSTEDFVRAIESVASDKIILLPNNTNIIMAARQAASLVSHKSVEVIPSKSLPQGISAMLAYTNNPHLDSIEAVTAAMLDALEHAITGEITTATRDADFEGVTVKQGQYIGLLDGRLVASGTDLGSVMLSLLEQADAGEHELITLYYGAGVTEAQACEVVDALSEEFDEQEFDVVRGDQPLYPFIISVE